MLLYTKSYDSLYEQFLIGGTQPLRQDANREFPQLLRRGPVLVRATAVALDLTQTYGAGKTP
jgi:hypothetical protein